MRTLSLSRLVFLFAALLVCGPGGCGGATEFVDVPTTGGLIAGEDGDFVRPADRAESIAWRRQQRTERRTAKRKARRSRQLARRTRTEQQARGSRHVSLATRPAGPSSAEHRTPQAASKPENAGLSRVKQRWDKATRRARTARRFVGRTDMGSKPFVMQVLKAAGQRFKVEGRPFAARLHKKLRKARKLVSMASARPGDIAFFAKTHDLNGNGRPDDGITWAGVVEQLSDGRLVFIAHRAGRVRAMAATPSRPKTVRDGDDVLNTRLVRWPGASRSLTAGECLVAIGRL